ncbi:MAG: hypothetical protein RL560_17 [Actinomycetota bacterium]|jgi:hypothetical protein
MTIELTAEQKAFVRVFMRTGGCDFNQDKVEQLLMDYEHDDSFDIVKKFGSEMYSAVLDALDVWHSAIFFEKQQALLRLSTIG